jgi:hypothetical protein
MSLVTSTPTILIGSSRCESAHYFAGGVWMERTHVRCYREKQAECGRPRPQQGTDGDATWMIRWRLGWQRCCARGRARSGLISGWPVGTNAVPKSFCDGRLGQLAFEYLLSKNILSKTHFV